MTTFLLLPPTGGSAKYMTLHDWPLARRVERTNLPLASPQWPSLDVDWLARFEGLTRFCDRWTLPRTDLPGLQQGKPEVTWLVIRGPPSLYDWLPTSEPLEGTGQKQAAVSRNWRPDQESSNKLYNILLEMEGTEQSSPGRSLLFPSGLLAPPSTRSLKLEKSSLQNCYARVLSVLSSCTGMFSKSSAHAPVSVCSISWTALLQPPNGSLSF